MIDLDEQQTQALEFLVEQIGRARNARTLQRMTWFMRACLSIHRAVCPKHFAKFDSDRKAAYLAEKSRAQA